MEYKIKAIVPDDSLGSTPARVLRKSGIVFINSKIWNSLSPAARKFILLHEEGHHILDTGNEFEADEYAFYRYAGSEKYSLKNTLRTITQTLDPQKPEHAQRIRNLIYHILLFDYLNYNNENALKMYTQLTLSPNMQNYIKDKLVEFLKAKGVKSVTDLSQQERQKVLEEFLQTPAILELVYRKSLKDAVRDTEENFSGRRKHIKELRRQLKEKKLAAKIENYEEYKEKRKKQLKQLAQYAKPVLGTVASAAGTALGVPQAGTLVGKLLGQDNDADKSVSNAENQVSMSSQQDNQSMAPEQLSVQQPDTKSNSKNFTLLGIGLILFTGIVLLLTQKRGF